MPESPYPGPPPPGPRNDPPGESEPTPGGPGPGDGPPTAPSPPPRTCAVCGSDLDPDQAYCLECGAPSDLAPRLRRSTGGLALVAAGLAILGAGAGALAYVASQDDPRTTTTSVTVPTSSVITVPTDGTPTTETDSGLPGDTTGTLPPDTTFTTPTSGALPPDPTITLPDSGMLTETGPGANGQTASDVGPPAVVPDPGGGATGSDDWPAGTSGWTAIVASALTEAGARTAKRRLTASGEPGGVLYSSDHPPLRPGYWVAFSGTFTTRQEALAHARTLVGRFPGAYPRRVDA
jgi:hypothetical protein